jgi:hypothetical protein
MKLTVMLALVVVVVGCVMQPAPQTQAPYAQQYGAAPGASPGSRPTQAQPGYNGRRITFNTMSLDAEGWRIVAALDAHWGTQLPDGDYWYDPLSGAAGVWGGPTAIMLPPAMPLGGGMVPANASGGGDGRLTGIFINGRELHPDDVAMLAYLIGVQPQAGRWWADAAGNFGPEGWAAVGNVYNLAQSRQGGAAWSHGSASGSSTFWVGSDGNGYNWAMDGASGCSYASDGGGVIC